MGAQWGGVAGGPRAMRGEPGQHPSLQPLVPLLTAASQLCGFCPHSGLRAKAEGCRAPLLRGSWTTWGHHIAERVPRAGRLLSTRTPPL